jgi:cofilin
VLSVFAAVQGGDLRWATFSVNQGPFQVEVDQTADRDASFESLFEALTSATGTLSSVTDNVPVGARYAVAAAEYDAEGGSERRCALVLIVWVPDTAKIKEKMIYASCKDSLKRALQGIDGEFSATDESELAYIREACAERRLGKVVSPSAVKSANKR